MTEPVDTTPAPRPTPPWVVPTVVGALLALAILVIFAVIFALREDPASVESLEVSSPASMTADGGIRFEGVDGALVVADPNGEAATTSVELYVDWSCPICRDFEGAYSEELTGRVAAGELVLEVHPVAILDRAFLDSEYSSRAANVAACVAEHAPDAFLAVQYGFFAAQPDEGTVGYDDAQLVELLGIIGVTDADVVSCVENGDFRDWVAAITAATVSRAELAGDTGGFGTPTVVIDGERWNPATDGELLALLDAR